MYGRIRTLNEGRLELCGPGFLGTERARKDPVNSLMMMRKISYPASVGGWHQATDSVIGSYAMARSVLTNPSSERLLKSHCVWPALSFVCGLNTHACCLLIASVLDPRRFVDRVRPDRSAKLKRYLGLDKETVASVLDNKMGRYASERCAMAMSAWMGDGKTKDIESPGEFVRRVYSRNMRRTDGNKVVSALRATQVFVDYLRHVWLAALSVGNNTTEAMYAAEHFFNTESEVKGFVSHMRKVL
jgi:hypothetical protein